MGKRQNTINNSHYEQAPGDSDKENFLLRGRNFEQGKADWWVAICKQCVLQNVPSVCRLKHFPKFSVCILDFEHQSIT